MSKRHIQSYFDLNEDELSEFHTVISKAKESITKDYSPDSYNIGINDGAAAGQTVPHLHIHIIPRYKNDTEDPRGGVRWVIPDKAKYWED